MRTKPSYITMQVGRRFLVIRVPASGKRGYLMGTASNQITAEELVDALYVAGDRAARKRAAARTDKAPRNNVVPIQPADVRKSGAVLT